MDHESVVNPIREPGGSWNVNTPLAGTQYKLDSLPASDANGFLKVTLNPNFGLVPDIIPGTYAFTINWDKSPWAVTSLTVWIHVNPIILGPDGELKEVLIAGEANIPTSGPGVSADKVMLNTSEPFNTNPLVDSYGGKNTDRGTTRGTWGMIGNFDKSSVFFDTDKAPRALSPHVAGMTNAGTSKGEIKYSKFSDNPYVDDRNSGSYTSNSIQFVLRLYSQNEFSFMKNKVDVDTRPC